MRRVGVLVLGLILVAWILIEVPVAQTETLPAVPQWRRTVDGWELRSSWSTGPYVRPARLHPAVVGSLEFLVSLAALVAFSAAPGKKPSRMAQSSPAAPHHQSIRQRRSTAARLHSIQ